MPEIVPAWHGVPHPDLCATGEQVKVKAWHIDGNNEWHELGGYRTDIVARNELALLLTKRLSEEPSPARRISGKLDTDHLANGERDVVWLGDDQYLIDNPQARVDAGQARKCPRCCEMVDDSRWANEPCARCVGEDIGADDLETMRERLEALEALEALRPEVELWSQEDEADRLDRADDIAAKLAEIFGISR